MGMGLGLGLRLGAGRGVSVPTTLLGQMPQQASLLGVWPMAESSVIGARTVVPNKKDSNPTKNSLIGPGRRQFNNGAFYSGANTTIVDNAATAYDGSNDASTLVVGAVAWNLTVKYQAGYGATGYLPNGNYMVAIRHKWGGTSGNQFLLGDTQAGGTTITSTSSWQRSVVPITVTSGTGRIGLNGVNSSGVNLQISDLEVYAGSVDPGADAQSSALYTHKLLSVSAAEPILTNGILATDNGNTVLYLQLATAFAAGPCTIAWTSQTSSSPGLNGYTVTLAGMPNGSGIIAGQEIAGASSIFNVNGAGNGSNSVGGTENSPYIDRIGAGCNTNVITYDGSVVKCYSGGFCLSVNTLTSSFSLKDFYIGLLSNNYFAGIQYAVLNMWNACLTYAEVQTVTTANNGYLVSKGGTIEPVRAFVFIGDSITRGVGASTYANAWAYKTFSTCSKKLRASNIGHSGGNIQGGLAGSVLQTFADAVALVPSNKLGGKMGINIAYGANDLNNGASTAAQFIQNLKDVTDYCRTGGFDFVTWSTVINRCDQGDAGPGTAMDGRRTTFNASALAAVGQAHGPDALIDVAADSRLGAPLAFNTTTYSADKCHPNDAGHLIYAGIANTTIAALPWGY